MLFSTFSRQYLGLKNNQNYARSINHILCLLQPFFSSKSQSLAFRKEWNDKSSNADSKNTFNVLSSCCPFEKNVLSNIYVGFFGADAILANTKAWDLVLWKCPRRSTTFDLLQLFILHWKVNTFKTPEMCLYLDSDVWAGRFTIIFVGSFHHLKPVSCWILVCENVTGIPRPFDQLASHMAWER